MGPAIPGGGLCWSPVSERPTSRRSLGSSAALGLLTALGLFAARPALADAAFSDEKEFLAAVGRVSFESFEELTADDTVGRNRVRAAAFTVGSGRRRELGIFQSAISGLHATHGSTFLVWDAAPSAITFVFESPITAFGLTLNDALDQGEDSRLSVSTNGGADFPDLLVGPLGDAEERFIGIVADAPFDRLTLAHTSRDSVGLDGVHYSPTAGAQPEAPASPPSPEAEEAPPAAGAGAGGPAGSGAEGEAGADRAPEPQRVATQN